MGAHLRLPHAHNYDRVLIERALDGLLTPTPSLAMLTASCRPLSAPAIAGFVPRSRIALLSTMVCRSYTCQRVRLYFKMSMTYA